MANIKTKLGSLTNFDQAKKRTEWKRKIHSLKMIEARKKRMEKDVQRLSRHMEHLKACALKALAKAESIQARLEKEVS